MRCGCRLLTSMHLRCCCLLIFTQVVMCIQIGDTVRFIIVSENAADMHSLTASVNTTAMADSIWTVSLLPESKVAVGVVTASAPVHSTLAGFEIDNVRHQNVSWIVDGRFMPGIPNTVASLYLSKLGHWPTARALDTLQQANFPCIDTSSICCLSNYSSDYVVGAFAQTIQQVVGSCTEQIQGVDTDGLFDTRNQSTMITGVLTDFPNSTSTSSAQGSFQLSLLHEDIVASFAQKTEYEDGHYELRFFIGMVYLTMLPTNALFTSVSQSHITLNISPSSMTFAFSSAQSYNFVKYVAMTVHQNKWIDPYLQVYEMQFVTIGLVLPVGIQADVHTGLVEMSSVRIAIAENMPDNLDPMAWSHACTGASREVHELYKHAAGQPCSFNREMCLNPVAHGTLVEFSFPVGDGNITAAMLTQNRLHIFVSFEMSVVGPSGVSVVTNIFTEALLHGTSITKSCETVDAYLTLEKLTEIDITVGLVGNANVYNTSVTTLHDIMANPLYDRIVTIDSIHSSLASSLLTFVVRAKPTLVETFHASTYMLQLDYLVSMHFLDVLKFDAVQLLMQQGLAYTSHFNPDGFMEVRFTNDAIDQCTGGNDLLALASGMPAYSCGIRRGVVASVPILRAVHDFSDGNHLHDESGCVEFITDNLLSDTNFARELATNMTDLIRDKYEINNLLSRAWYVNPGFPWPTPSGSTSLQLADKMIAVAAVTLRDTATGKTAGRRLLNIVNNPGTTQLAHTIQKTPLQATSPTLQFQTNVTDTIRRIFEVDPSQQWALVELVVHIHSLGGNLKTYRDRLDRELHANPHWFQPHCTQVHRLFKNVYATIQPAPTQYEGRITYLLVFEQQWQTSQTKVPSDSTGTVTLSLHSNASMGLAAISDATVSFHYAGIFIRETNVPALVSSLVGPSVPASQASAAPESHQLPQLSNELLFLLGTSITCFVVLVACIACLLTYSICYQQQKNRELLALYKKRVCITNNMKYS